VKCFLYLLLFHLSQTFIYPIFQLNYFQFRLLNLDFEDFKLTSRLYTFHLMKIIIYAANDPNVEDKFKI